jgi:16S rRNA (guanine966-N2)-methyltransferase
MKNQLRIIGGDWKRRTLPFASIEGLRPTPDRVRETLFNWLMWDIQNSQVLDLCSGSGALAFEALSRGAAKVVMIEPNPIQARFLKENIQLLKADNCQLLTLTAQQALKKLNTHFDVVFRPPYDLALWEELAELADPIITENAFIYVEADRELSQLKLPSSWQKLKKPKQELSERVCTRKILKCATKIIELIAHDQMENWKDIHNQSDYFYSIDTPYRIQVKSKNHLKIDCSYLQLTSFD